MTTETPLFERVHDCWQAVILEAVQGWKRPVSLPYLGPLLSGRSCVVWDYSNDARGWDNQAVTHLLPALLAQANRYERMGLSVSAADCRWLAHELTIGELTIVGAHHLDMVQGTVYAEA